MRADALAAHPASNTDLEPVPQAPPAGIILMAPQGDMALAQVGNDLYTVQVPVTGGATPLTGVSVEGLVVSAESLGFFFFFFAPSWSSSSLSGAALRAPVLEVPGPGAAGPADRSRDVLESAALRGLELRRKPLARRTGRPGARGKTPRRMGRVLHRAPHAADER